MPIPVNIITGVLGVGKTTAIRHLLSLRPPHEKWAIVVNEFGALGIDGAVLDTAGGLHADAAETGPGVVVREVAGGCLCCAVSAPFTVAVTQLLRRAKPDRLLIEPSGLGHPTGLFDALAGEHLGKTLEIRATIALVDVSEVGRRGELFESEAFHDQVQCADAVVGTKADVAGEEDVEAFRRWAEHELYPAKSRVDVIAHGRLPLETLDIACGPTLPRHEHREHRARRERDMEEAAKAESGGGGGFGVGTAVGPLGRTPMPTAVAPGKAHRVLGGTEEFKTAGWVFSREDVFVRPKLKVLFEALAAEPRVKRVKGVMRVGADWVMPTFETGELGMSSVKLEPIAYRRDSRLEVIVMASTSAGGNEDIGVGVGEEEGCPGRAAAACDWDALEAAIKAAMKPPKS